MTALPRLVSKRARQSVEPDRHRRLLGEGHRVAAVARHGEFARDHPVLPGANGAHLNADDVELRAPLPLRRVALQHPLRKNPTHRDAQLASLQPHTRSATELGVDLLEMTSHFSRRYIMRCKHKLVARQRPAGNRDNRR